MYRVENKYLVSDADIAVLKARLDVLMQIDPHQQGSCYEIRSIYFDDLQDSCMQENEAGVNQREKYRIRMYGAESSLIRLEIKEKYRGLTRKTSCKMTAEEVVEITAGAMPSVQDTRAPLNRLGLQMRCMRLRPKAVIAYERTAYVYPAGNVRVTFDRNIAASARYQSFFNDRITGLVPVLPAGLHVLEVKYDEFFPDFIAQQLEIGKLRKTAFSKYYLGRLALRGEFPL